MKMKKVLMMLCSVLVFTACSSDDDDYTKLSVDLKDLSLSFTAKATESLTVTVDTDQETWAAKPDKDWCKVALKGSNQFVVTAEPNMSGQASEAAIITVTATGAKPIQIKVTQVAATAEEQEQAAYDKYVNADMRAAITKLNMPINRGINPPKIEGYYRMKYIFLSTTNSAENSYLGTRFNDGKHYFYNQEDFQVSMKTYYVEKDTDNHSSTHEGTGTFITGEGNKFSIFMEEKAMSNGYTSISLTILSGEVVKTSDKITGIRDFRYAFIMKDRGGNPNVVHVGQGRVFKDDEAAVITKEQFEKLVQSTGLKSGSSDSGISLISSLH
jgi:hypothetical protein